MRENDCSVYAALTGRGGVVAGALMVLAAPFVASLHIPAPVLGGCFTVILGLGRIKVKFTRRVDPKFVS